MPPGKEVRVTVQRRTHGIQNPRSTRQGYSHQKVRRPCSEQSWERGSRGQRLAVGRAPRAGAACRTRPASWTRAHVSLCTALGDLKTSPRASRSHVTARCRTQLDECPPDAGSLAQSRKQGGRRQPRSEGQCQDRDATKEPRLLGTRSGGGAAVSGLVLGVLPADATSLCWPVT